MLYSAAIPEISLRICPHHPQKLPLNQPQILQQPQPVLTLHALILGPYEKHLVVQPDGPIYPHPPLGLELHEPPDRLDVLRQQAERLRPLLDLRHRQAEHRRSVSRILTVVGWVALRGSGEEPRRVYEFFARNPPAFAAAFSEGWPRLSSQALKIAALAPCTR